MALSGAYALVLTAGLGFSIYTIAWASGNPEPSCDWEQVGFVDYPVCVNRTKLGPLVVNSSFEECYFYTGLYRDCRGVSDASVMCLMKVLPGGVVIVKDSMMKSDSVLVLGGLMGIVTSSLCLQAVLSRVLQIVVGD